MTITTTNPESNSSIRFRTKFEKLVTDANRPILVSVFEKFCRYNPFTTNALEILWQLTYNDDVAISTLCNTLGLSLDIISSENISKFRDELRYQYECQHGSYLLKNIPSCYATEFDNLVKHSDLICADVITKKCLEYHEESINPSRALYLLESDMENNYFGGLRELGFDQDESQFLKQYHKEIFDLYTAIYNMYDIEGCTLDDEICNNYAEKAAQSSFKPLTSVEILNNRDIFASFVKDFNVLVDIGKLGFDLNEVIAKKEAIVQLLNADKALSKQF